ncbi:MAG: hypothetical protein M1114_02085 [Candidatus Dependentiae bacterium]|nr:hypothetical protein [Candidatus Dependentiae bacterium]
MKLSRHMPLLLAVISSAHASVLFADLWDLSDMGAKDIIFVFLSIAIEFFCYYFILHRGILRTLLVSIVINGIYALISFVNKFLLVFFMYGIIGVAVGKDEYWSGSNFPLLFIGFIGIIVLNTVIESVVSIPFFGTKNFKKIVYAVLIANILSVAVGVLGMYLIGY